MHHQCLSKTDHVVSFISLIFFILFLLHGDGVGEGREGGVKTMKV